MAVQVKDVTIDPYATYEELWKEQGSLLRRLSEELYGSIPMANELWVKCLKMEYDLVHSQSKNKKAVEELCDSMRQLCNVIGYYFHAMGVFQGIEISTAPEEQLPAVLH